MNPKKKQPIDLKSLARSYTKASVQTLGGICATSNSDSARVAAATALLDRGWGKPAQPHTGEDGGAIEIILRNLAAEKKPKA